VSYFLEFNMESGNNDQALFNSSTEFLIAFDSADDTKQLGVSGQQCEDSSAVTGEKMASDETFTSAQPVKTADTEHIICEFSDGDTDWFTSRNTGAGETVNADNIWLSLSPGIPSIHTHEFDGDRRSDYVKQSVDISSYFTGDTDNATEATDVTLLELVDTSCKTVTDGDQNHYTQLSASVLTPDLQFTNEHDSAKLSSNTFSDLIATVTDNTNETQMQITNKDGKKLGDGDKNQCVNPSEPFLADDKFSQQLSDGEHVSDMPVFTTADIFDQPLVQSNDKVSLEKTDINNSFPDVHTSAVKQELISEFPNYLFTEEANPDVIAEKPELSQPVLVASDAITIDEIQVIY